MSILSGSLRVAIATALIAVGCLDALSQSNKGTITPVESDDEAPQKPTLHYYDKHGDRLETPVLYMAELDTATRVRPSSPYPLWNGMVIGANFGDAILKLAGQKHMSYGVSVAVSLHNWFFPIIEAGMGWGGYTENNNLFHISAKPSFYAKVGMNYNFLYKSKPDYMVYLGARLGMSECRWDKTDIHTTNEEGVTTTLPDELNQRCFSMYGELVAGLKVKIGGPVALGWNVKFRAGQHNSGGKSPWFVPGSGTGSLGVNVTAYFTFGEKPRREGELIKKLMEEETEIPEEESSQANTGLH